MKKENNDSSEESLQGDVSDGGGEKKSCCPRVTLEPVVLAYIFGFGFQSVVAQRLVLDKVCLVDLGLNGTICSNHSGVQEVEVQRRSNLIFTAWYALCIVPGLILCVFLGPWSDENGRKPLLVLPLLGYVVSYSYLILYAAWDELGGWWYIGSTLNALIGGGPMVLLTGVFSYYTDITTTENRTARLGFLSTLFLAGFPIGIFAGGLMFKPLGYIGVFVVASVLAVANVMYVLLCVEESLGTMPPTAPRESVQKSIAYNIRHRLATVILTAFRPRGGHGRLVVILLMVIVVLCGTQVQNDGYLYRYTRLKFGWDTFGFSLFSSITALYSALGIILLLPVQMSLAVEDTTVGIMGNLSGLFYCFLIAFARSSEWMYVAGATGIFMGFIPIVIRSMLSKVAGSSEVGSIFAMMSLVETLVPLAMNPLVALLYNATVAEFPGALYCALAALNLVMGVIFFVIRLLSNTEGYTHMEGERD